MTQLWKDRILLGIYNLSPLHYGIGQTTGAVDLPIARDAATRIPILPATGIKGVLRDYSKSQLDKAKLRGLFGAEIGEDADRAAGRLTVTEARLIAYPARSLGKPFLHVTCPLILERLRRDLVVSGTDEVLPLKALSFDSPVLVSNRELNEKTLVLEGLVYEGKEVRYTEEARWLAGKLAQLLPEDEKPSRERLTDNLAIIPDDDFVHLMRAALPIQARIRLTGGKTTDTWMNPDTGEEEKGNLWYEEYLPADCLFAAVIGERNSRNGVQESTASKQVGLSELRDVKSTFRVVQLGGNETVGFGISWMTVVERQRGDHA